MSNSDQSGQTNPSIFARSEHLRDDAGDLATDENDEVKDDEVMEMSNSDQSGQINPSIFASSEHVRDDTGDLVTDEDDEVKIVFEQVDIAGDMETDEDEEVKIVFEQAADIGDLATGEKDEVKDDEVMEMSNSDQSCQTNPSIFASSEHLRDDAGDIATDENDEVKDGEVMEMSNSDQSGQINPSTFASSEHLRDNAGDLAINDDDEVEIVFEQAADAGDLANDEDDEVKIVFEKAADTDDLATDKKDEVKDDEVMEILNSDQSGQINPSTFASSEHVTDGAGDLEADEDDEVDIVLEQAPSNSLESNSYRVECDGVIITEHQIENILKSEKRRKELIVFLSWFLYYEVYGTLPNEIDFDDLDFDFDPSTTNRVVQLDHDYVKNADQEIPAVICNSPSDCAEENNMECEALPGIQEDMVDFRTS